MPAVMIFFCVLAVVAGMWLAVNVFAGPMDWFFGLIWKDKSVVHRAEVAKRVKELCVDGTVPEETAIMLVARESGITERELLESLNAVSPAQLKAMLSGDYKSLFGFTSWEKFFGGKGRGR